MHIEIERIAACDPRRVARAVVEQGTNARVGPDDVLPSYRRGEGAMHRVEQVADFGLVDHGMSGLGIPERVRGADQREVALERDGKDYPTVGVLNQEGVLPRVETGQNDMA